MENFKASIDLELGNLGKIEDQLLRIFDERKITKFREELDAIFRERKGAEESQRKLLESLKLYRDIMNETNLQGEARLDLNKKLRAVDQTIAKVASEINSLTKERQQIEENALKNREKGESVLKKIAETESRIRNEQRESEERYQKMLEERRSLLLANRKERERSGSTLSRLVDAEKRINNEKQKQIQTQRQLNAHSERASASLLKTSLAGQEMIRIIQDAPFGLFGITNNIQALGDAIGTQVQKGHKLRDVLKSTFGALITGPMAIPLAITLLTTLAFKWDDIASGIDKAKVALGLLTKAQKEFNDAVRKMDEEGWSQTVAAITPASLPSATANLRDQVGSERQSLMFAEQAFESETGLSLKSIQLKQKTGAVINWGSRDNFEQFERLQQMRAALADSEDILGQMEARNYIESVRGGRREHLKSIGASFGDDSNPRNSRGRKKLTLEEIRAMAARQLGLDISNASLRHREAFLGGQLTEDTGIIQDAVADYEHRRQEAFGALQIRGQVASSNLSARQSMRQAGMFGIANPFDRARAESRGSFAGTMDSLSVRRQQLQDEIALRKEYGEDTRAQNAELASIRAEELAAEARHAEEIKRIKKDELQFRMQVGAQIVSATGDTLGSLAGIFAKEGEKGLEENKALLKAQAVVQAIAASVNLASQIISMPAGDPISKVGLAVASGAAIFTTLMAQIKQIDNVSKGNSSGGSGSWGAGFTVLNGSINQSRVMNFEAERNRDMVVERTSALKSMEAVSRSIGSMGSVKIVYDDKTAADIANRGRKYVERHR